MYQWGEHHEGQQTSAGEPAKPGSQQRMVRRIPVMPLCLVAHISGGFAALTIGQDFWPFMLCSMTGLVCVAIGMHRDVTPNDQAQRPGGKPGVERKGNNE